MSCICRRPSVSSFYLFFSYRFPLPHLSILFRLVSILPRLHPLTPLSTRITYNEPSQGKNKQKWDPTLSISFALHVDSYEPMEGFGQSFLDSNNGYSFACSFSYPTFFLCTYWPFSSSIGFLNSLVPLLSFKRLHLVPSLCSVYVGVVCCVYFCLGEMEYLFLCFCEAGNGKCFTHATCVWTLNLKLFNIDNRNRQCCTGRAEPAAEPPRFVVFLEEMASWRRWEGILGNWVRRHYCYNSGYT